jgi:uncharacterized protein YcgI (DUF1989 family)
MSERMLIPAREAVAVRVAADQSFRLIDVEGAQVVDLFAFVDGDVSEYASAEHTRVFVKRLFPRRGEPFVTNRRRPLLLLEEDSSPGVHDMLCAACDPTRYALLGHEGWHASCQENLERRMGELGYTGIEIPQPINLFMNVSREPDDALNFAPALTGAGDSVTLRALMPSIVVASACPMDLNVINGAGPTDVAIEVLDPA